MNGWVSETFRTLQDSHLRDEAYFLKQLIFLGRIYSYETDDEHLVSAFQQFLDQTADKKTTGNQTSNLLFQNIIKRVWKASCNFIRFPNNSWTYFSWHQSAKIFSSNAFSKASSTNAFCLTRWWNEDGQLTVIAVPSTTLRRMISIHCNCSIFFCFQANSFIRYRNVPYYSEVTGPDMGLILVVNNSRDDYFYNIFNTMGFSVSLCKLRFSLLTFIIHSLQIQIHNFNEFPDPSSGSSIQRFIDPGREVFIRVDGDSISSEREILGYDAEKRQCLFPDENPLYNGKYTRSECILNCKIRSIKALCDCVPFQYPPAKPKSDPPKVCSLQHVSCLKNYKSKKIYVKIIYF